MIIHIVMWKVKEKALGKSKLENIQDIKTMLENLKYEIKELKEIEVGVDIPGLTGSHDIVLYTKFENEEDLDIYQKHPKHVKVAQVIREVATDRACVDYRI